jgi:hypothetical protein
MNFLRHCNQVAPAASHHRKESVRGYTDTMTRRTYRGWLLWMLLAASALGQESPPPEERSFRSVVPVVGYVRGVGDVQWMTELAMSNPHASEITVGLTLMGGGEPFFLTTLAPGQTLAAGELVGGVLGSPGRISILEIGSIGAGPVSVGVRVIGYKDGGVVAIQPIPVYGSTLPFSRQRLDGLAVNEHFRSNVGIANSGDEPGIVTLALRRIGDRDIAFATVPVPPRSLLHWPVRRFFPLLTEGTGLSVVAEPSSAEIIVYGSVISNSTHEARFVAPAPAW